VYLQPAILPDGRTVVAGYHETTGWILRVGDESGEGPDLRVLLERLLPGHPDWIPHAHEELAGRGTPRGRRWPCACCGCFTLDEPGRASFQICPVCYWEDDRFQFDHPTETGANAVSLETAIRNYRAHGVSEPRLSDFVRPATLDEVP